MRKSFTMLVLTCLARKGKSLQRTVQSPLFQCRHISTIHPRRPMHHKSICCSSSSSLSMLTGSQMNTLMESLPRSHLSTLTKTKIWKMRKSDLQMECSFRGLPTKGDRGTLISRLMKTLDDDSTKPKDLSRLKELDVSQSYVLRVKGHTTPNSSGAGIGLVLYYPETNEEVWAGRVYCPGDRVGFEAEYSAIILGLSFAKSCGIQNLTVQTINEIIVFQINGVYQVQKKSLKPLLAMQKKGEEEFASFSVAAIPSSQNDVAAELATKALATQKSINLPKFWKFRDPMVLVEEEEEVVMPAVGEPMGEVKEPDDLAYAAEIDTLGIYDEVEYPEVGVPIVEAPDDPERAMEIDTSRVYENDEEEMPRMAEPMSEARQADSPTNAAGIDTSKTYLLRFDGGSRGNPGAAGAGMVLYDDRGEEIWSGWKFHSEPATNNVAEYLGLLCGLKCAHSFGVTQLIAEGDSQLIVKQLNGHYRVKNAELKKFHKACVDVADNFKYFEIRHIPRAENSRADWLANHAMDLKESHGYFETMDI